MSFLLICFAPHIFRTPRIIVDCSVNTNLNLEEISRQTYILVPCVYLCEFIYYVRV